MPNVMVTGNIKGQLAKLCFEAKPGKRSVFQIVAVAEEGFTNAELCLRAPGREVASVDNNSWDSAFFAFSNNGANGQSQSTSGLVSVWVAGRDVPDSRNSGSNSAPTAFAIDHKTGAKVRI